MNKFVLGAGLLLACNVFTSAQTDKGVLAEARQIRLEMLKEHRLEQRAQQQVDKQAARPSETASLTDAQVGEASSFNRNAKFFGTASSGVIIVEPDCDPVIIGPLGPDDRCLEVTNPAVTTSGIFNDVGRITLPGKQADNVIYLIANHNTSFVFLNTDGTTASGLATYIPSITVESVALNDPAAIDPATGLPMGGSYTITGLGTKSSNKTLAPGSVDVQTDNYSRANTTGLSRSFWSAVGLPDAVINELFKKPMTIRLNIRVNVRRVESGLFTFSTRLLAN